MDFIIQWLWYLSAFVAGSAIVWAATVLTIKHTSEEQALAALPDSRPNGDRS
jgi:uncharacterized membrane protein ArfB